MKCRFVASELLIPAKNCGIITDMKYAIFGGAFDPLHVEHIRIATEARDALGLDAVVMVPTFRPPHKHSKAASFDDRLAMLKAFAATERGILVDPIERDLALDKSYTSDVLPLLIEKYGSDGVYLIGGDSMVKFSQWHLPEKIAAMLPIVAVRRKGYDAVDRAAEFARTRYGANVRVVDFDCRSVSSSDLKARAALGISLLPDVTPEVADYIGKRGLYRDYDAIVARLKASVSERLFGHIARTAIAAVRYASQIGVDYDKAFVAALLHDCAKQMPPLYPLSSYRTKSNAVIHQYDGAEIAKTQYGVEDAEILEAIRYHTTGKPGMSRLGQIVYVADKLEEGRNYEGIEALRRLVREDFDRGFLAVVEHGMQYLQNSGNPVDDLTVECYNYYKNSGRQPMPKE